MKEIDNRIKETVIFVIQYITSVMSMNSIMRGTDCDSYLLERNEDIKVFTDLVLRNIDIGRGEWVTRIAALTVLTAGSFNQNRGHGYYFIMPSEEDCCEAYLDIERKYKRKVPLYLTVFPYTESGQDEYTIPILPDRTSRRKK